MLLLRRRPHAAPGPRAARRCRALAAAVIHRSRCLPDRRARAAALADLLRELRRLAACPRRLLVDVMGLLEAESYRPAE